MKSQILPFLGKNNNFTDIEITDETGYHRRLWTNSLKHQDFCWLIECLSALPHKRTNTLGETNSRICHEVGWVCPITSIHLQHVTNLYISMFFIRYHSKIGLWNVLRDFPIAMEIPSKHQVRFNDFNSVTSYLWLNWMCRVLIGQSYLIAWVWILAIAIAIGPLLIRPITKNYLCYRISGWSIFWLVEIIKYQQTVLPSTNRSVIIFSLLGRTVVKNRRRRQLINLFCLENVVYYKLRDKIVVQSLVINIGTCFARSYNVFLADDLSYGNVFLELRSRKTLP